MADKKISELTELTSANAATDFLPVVDTSAVETKKITLANLPLSDSAKGGIYPYTTDVQSGVIQTRNLTTITNSDGFYNTYQPDSIYIGTNVTSIGSAAFSNSNFLGANLANQSVTIPDSVTTIGSFAFYYSALTSVKLPNNPAFTSIEQDTFGGCTSLTSITIPNSVTSIGSQAFRYSTGLISVTIGNSVTSIGNYAFQGCNSLTSMNIPDSVTSIGTYAFDGCSSLTSVIIPDSVTSIGSYAFQSCSGLTSIIIGKSVTSIGSYAFLSNNSLATINCLATTAPTLGSGPFNNVAASDIHVPVGATYPATYGGLTVVFDL